MQTRRSPTSGPSPSEHTIWAEERRGAVLLLAALADNDREELRRAATGEWVAPGARDLLIDAADECE